MRPLWLVGTLNGSLQASVPSGEGSRVKIWGGALPGPAPSPQAQRSLRLDSCPSLVGGLKGFLREAKSDDGLGTPTFLLRAPWASVSSGSLNQLRPLCPR